MALGWLVTRKHDLCFRVLGWQMTQGLSTRYLAWALRVLPEDQDRDGVPDGAELFWGSSPRDAHDHPGLDAALTDRYYEILFAGERKSLRWRVNSLSETVPVARGFRLKFSADEPVLLRPGSKGEPIAGPITVTVDEWGAFAIHILRQHPQRPRQIARRKPLRHPPAEHPETQLVLPRHQPPQRHKAEPCQQHCDHRHPHRHMPSAAARQRR